MSLLKKYSSKTGKAPGHLYYTGDKRESVKIEIISYDENSFEQEILEIERLKEIENKFEKINDKNVIWVNVFGLHNIDVVKYLGEMLDIPNLHLEDALNIGERPKINIDKDYTFLLLNMIKKEKSIIYEQISVFSKDNIIITFQEMEGDVFDPVRDRIKNNKGTIRVKDKDYLFYALLDVILDNYFVFMMNIEKSIEILEEEAMINEEDDLLKDIYYYKKELVKLRNSILPMKDIIKNLKDNASNEDDKYYEDLYDHIYFMIDSLNVFREMINGIYEIYISNISNRMNKVMTVLTIFSAIFIPMTFLAGVYGMNFKYMPGLDNTMSFPIFVVVCLCIFLVMIVFFKRKRWL